MNTPTCAHREYTYARKVKLEPTSGRIPYFHECCNQLLLLFHLIKSKWSPKIWLKLGFPLIRVLVKTLIFCPRTIYKGGEDVGVMQDGGGGKDEASRRKDAVGGKDVEEKKNTCRNISMHSRGASPRMRICQFMLATIVILWVCIFLPVDNWWHKIWSIILLCFYKPRKRISKRVCKFGIKLPWLYGCI